MPCCPHSGRLPKPQVGPLGAGVRDVGGAVLEGGGDALVVGSAVVVGAALDVAGRLLVSAARLEVLAGAEVVSSTSLLSGSPLMTALLGSGSSGVPSSTAFMNVCQMAPGRPEP